MLTVIIPTYNRNDLLVKCLKCLSPSSQDLVARYEVIVTDDSKGNIAKGLIEKDFPWATWIEGPKAGPAANRNNGAKKATGEWLVFIDDDCLPDNQLLRQYTHALESHNDVLVFEGSIRPDRPRKSFSEECPANESGGWLWSCNFMIKRDVFLNTLNGFDEQFPYPAMEDVELAYRLEKKGITVIFLKDASVIHPWRDQKKIYQITLNRFKSTLYFLEKHPEKKAEINSLYFLRTSYNVLVKYGLTKLIAYNFRGVHAMLLQSFMNVYFSIYIMLVKV